MPTLYHETQIDLQCGLASLNNAVQGPVWTFEELYAIAQEMDAEERRVDTIAKIIHNALPIRSIREWAKQNGGRDCG